jgi:hypothetical protein
VIHKDRNSVREKKRSSAANRKRDPNNAKWARTLRLVQPQLRSPPPVQRPAPVQHSGTIRLWQAELALQGIRAAGQTRE